MIGRKTNLHRFPVAVWIEVIVTLLYQFHCNIVHAIRLRRVILLNAGFNRHLNSSSILHGVWKFVWKLGVLNIITISMFYPTLGTCIVKDTISNFEMTTKNLSELIFRAFSSNYSKRNIFPETLFLYNMRSLQFWHYRETSKVFSKFHSLKKIIS